MVTIREVAILAGVSTATVSRVLRGETKGIRLETRQKVLVAASQLNYRSAKRAQRILAAVVPDIRNPYFTEIARAIEQEADEHEFTVVVCNMDRCLYRTEAFLQFVRERDVEGVILAGGGVIDHAFRQVWSRLAAETKIVMIGRHNVDASIVRVQEVEGAARSVEHLISLGHTRIAMVCGPSTSVAALDRLEGYMNALFGNNIPYSSEYIFEGDHTCESGYLAASRILRLNPRPTAVFAANDPMAVGLIRGLQEGGVSVPQDIAVVGFDKLAAFEHFTPRLTSLCVPLQEMGRVAVQLMLKTLADEPPQEVILPAKLSIGESCGARGGKANS